MRRFLALVLLSPALLFLAMASSAVVEEKMLGTFDPDWQDEWRIRKLARTPNQIDIAVEDGNDVLRMRSNASASAVVHAFKIEDPGAAVLQWRWKVENILTGNTGERDKDGDDYAARVLVVFEQSFLPWRSRSLCYVWSAHEPVGTVFASPYTDKVGTIVVQSGDVLTGQWQSQSRDLVADYTEYFGKSPHKISAVVLIVDTDQTGAQALSMFDDVMISYSTLDG